MKRKLKWLAIVVAVALLGFGTALLLWPRDRITAESWQKIQIGMTEKEVEDILGGPGKNNEEYEAHMLKEKNKRPIIDVLSEPEGGWLFVEGENTRYRYWIGHRGCMQVRFNPRGQVAFKFFESWRELSFIDRLRDWLGW